MTDLFYDSDVDDDVDNLSSLDTQESVAVHKPVDGPAPLFGLSGVEARLLTMIAENRIPHALLFHGQRGVGKFTTALRLARTLLAYGADIGNDAAEGLFGPAPAIQSLNTPDHHPAVHLISAGAHPDLLILGGEDAEKSKSGMILIDEARKVPGFLRLKPSTDNGWRVVIIDNADKLNRNAQNALLKILEEPPACAILILITHHLGPILPTIRSRAQTLRFSPLTDDDFESWLKRTDVHLDPQAKSWIRTLSQNCPGQAQMMMDLDAPALIDDFLKIWTGFPNLNDLAWVDYAERLSALEPEAYAYVFSFWVWWLSAMIHAKVDNAAATRLKQMTGNGMMENYMNIRTLGQMIDIRDAVDTIRTRTLGSSLEKRQALFSARMCMTHSSAA